MGSDLAREASAYVDTVCLVPLFVVAVTAVAMAGRGRASAVRAAQALSRLQLEGCRPGSLMVKAVL